MLLSRLRLSIPEAFGAVEGSLKKTAIVPSPAAEKEYQEKIRMKKKKKHAKYLFILTFLLVGIMRFPLRFLFIFLFFILKGNAALDQEEISRLTRATSRACVEDDKYMVKYFHGQPVLNVIDYLLTPRHNISEKTDLISAQQIIKNMINFDIDAEYRLYSETDSLQWEVHPSVLFPNPVLIFSPWGKIQSSILSQLIYNPNKRPPLEYLSSLAHIRGIPEWVPIYERCFHYWASVKGLEQLAL